jgi:hypothetical protein
MPAREREFFVQDLTSCRESLNQLKETFAGLEVELERLIKEEEARIQAGGLDADLVESNRQKLGDVMGLVNTAVRVNQDTMKTQDHTMSTLEEDLATIARVMRTLDEIDAEAETGLARGKRMFRRALFNGWITWTINVLLFLILGVCVVWKFGAFSSEDEPTASPAPTPDGYE